MLVQAMPVDRIITSGYIKEGAIGQSRCVSLVFVLHCQPIRGARF